MAYWFPLILGLSGTPLTKIMELLKVWAREATERAGGRPGPAKTLWILYPTCSLSASWGGLGFLFLFNCSLSSGPSVCAWEGVTCRSRDPWFCMGQREHVRSGRWSLASRERLLIHLDDNLVLHTWVCLLGDAGHCGGLPTTQPSCPHEHRTDSTSRSLPVTHPSSMSPRSGSLHRKALMVVFPLAPDHGRDFSGLCTWEHTQGPQNSLTADLGMSIFYLGRSSWNPLYHETSQLALRFSQ